MSFITKVKEFFNKYVFNEKWRCNVCDKEIFEEGYFCKDCLEKLPFNNGKICLHCGRKVIATEEYCTTCKNVLVSIDLGRSAFDYKDEVRNLIHSYKYDNKKYLAKVFASTLAPIFFKNFLDANVITYVSMTSDAEKVRGYNQSKELAEEVSKLVNVKVINTNEKKDDVKEQKKLNRQERLANITNAFKIINKKEIKGKNVVIIDDVTTTGATAEAIASKLKKAGALKVYLLTIASVSPIGSY
ncbi:MAG: ComF family protein [Clostridia bacterium]|nr:ComF family protein [Clostridia bacterium]